MKRDIEFHDIEQNTEEWLKLRCGIVTASNFGKIMANYPAGFGNPAKEYAQKKALERVTGKLDDSGSYSNSYMDRGHELEPVAKKLYEEQTFNKVDPGGFFTDGIIGDSPDGIVGKGRIEIKSVIPKTHWKTLDRGDQDPAYKWQTQGHILLGGEWCDFVSYCPEFPEGKQLLIYRVEPNPKMLKELTDRLEEFEALIQSYEKVLRS